MTIHEVLRTSYVAALARRVCGDHPVVVKRPAAYVVERPDETGREINRLIVLPPMGYTSNLPNQTNSYAEVERATLDVRGAVRAGKHGFSKLKDCLLVVSFNDAAMVSDLDRPYLEFDLEAPESGVVQATHSAGEAPFHVVKADGTGVYHTVLNLREEWLVLQLYKVLHPRRDPDLAPLLEKLMPSTKAVLMALHGGIVTYGDDLFDQQPALVDAVMALPPAITLPALGELLHVRDTGRHEACTAFALILKIGHRAPAAALNFLAVAKETGDVPTYYADQLAVKIVRTRSAMGDPGPPGTSTAEFG